MTINREQILSQETIAKINAELAPVTSNDTKARLDAHRTSTSQNRWGIWRGNEPLSEEAKRFWIGNIDCLGFVGAVAQRHAVQIVSSNLAYITFTVPNDPRDRNILHAMQSALSYRASITALIKDASIPDAVSLFGVNNRHLQEDDCFDESNFDWVYK